MVTMNNIYISAGTLAARFFSPLQALFAAGIGRSSKSRPKSGAEFSDADFTVLGVLRAAGNFQSGRHALQSLPDAARALDAPTPRATWFDALAHGGRLDALAQTDTALRLGLAARLPDALSHFEALAPFHICAGDGHWHAAAQGDEKDLKNSSIPVGHIYFSDYRTGLVRHHIACQSGGQEHDIKALERAGMAALKLDRSASKRAKTLIVYDRAAIKFDFWDRAKQCHGVYLVTRKRDDLVFPPGAPRAWNRDDSMNARVISDRIVEKNGVKWRLITVEKSGSPDEIIELLTNEMTLPPGLLAMLYLRRWDIERVFDCFKHHMSQEQAWAVSDVAKAAQGHFICMAYNLIKHLEHILLAEEKIRNAAEEARRQQRAAERMAEEKKRAAAAPKHSGVLEFLNPVLPHPELIAPRAVIPSIKLLRWLWAFMFNNQTPWEVMTKRLADVFANP